MKRRASFFKVISCFIIAFGLVLIPCILFAQTTRGKVEVDKDPKVDSLIGNYLVGGGPKGTASGVAGTGSSQGFRVQIFSGSNRKMAYNTQAKFQDRHPELRTYLSYREPNFKVQIGDFRSRLEAEKVVDDLRRSFTGLFIVSEKINLPKLDSE